MKKQFALACMLLMAGLGACKKDKKDSSPTPTPSTPTDTSTLTGYSVDGLKDFNLGNSLVIMPITVKKIGTAQSKLTITVGDVPDGVSTLVDTKSGIPDFSSNIVFSMTSVPPPKVYSLKVVIGDSANNKKTYRLNMTVDSFKYNILYNKSKLRVYKNSEVTDYYDIQNISGPTGTITSNITGLPSGSSATVDNSSTKFRINSGSAATGTYDLKLKSECTSAGISKEVGFKLLINDSCFRPLIKSYTNNTFSEDGGAPTTFSHLDIGQNPSDVNSIAFYTGSSTMPYFAFYVNCDGTIDVTDQMYIGYKSINGTGTYTTSPASITLNCVGEKWDGTKKTLKYTFNL